MNPDREFFMRSVAYAEEPERAGGSEHTVSVTFLGKDAADEFYRFVLAATEPETQS
jgi:hypothetical protein